MTAAGLLSVQLKVYKTGIFQVELNETMVLILKKSAKHFLFRSHKLIFIFKWRKKAKMCNVKGKMM